MQYIQWSIRYHSKTWKKDKHITRWLNGFLFGPASGGVMVHPNSTMENILKGTGFPYNMSPFFMNLGWLSKLEAISILVPIWLLSIKWEPPWTNQDFLRSSWSNGIVDCSYVPQWHLPNHGIFPSQLRCVSHRSCCLVWQAGGNYVSTFAVQQAKKFSGSRYKLQMRSYKATFGCVAGVYRFHLGLFKDRYFLAQVVSRCCWMGEHPKVKTPCHFGILRIVTSYNC